MLRVARVAALRAAVAEVVPETALVDAVPLTLPAVLTQTSLRMSGFCQNCGASSMMTWYWFRGL